MEAELQAIREAVARAARTRAPLRIRGSGSKDFYGRAAEGELLAVHGYRGVVDYDPAELVVTARGGTPLPELERLLEQSGQILPFEPPQFDGGGTLGGAIATGLSGPRRAYAGAARDFVLGVRVIDGLGQDLRFGGRVMKNVAGYHVSRLMTGAMGTLGVLAEISLKVLPAPRELTLRFECDERTALERMNRWSAHAVPLSATCFHAGVLCVRVAGSEPLLRSMRARLGGEEIGDATAFWRSIRDQTAGFFQSAATLWRLSVPSTTPPLELPAPQLIEWGGALRWLAADFDAATLRSMIERYGGHATLFRGSTGVTEVFHPLPPVLMRIHRELKRVFDPHGIFNPHRMYEL